MDFRSVLHDALRAAGLDYYIVAEVENIDVEMPMFTETGIVDVRLTDYDVILARSDVAVSRPTQANFSSAYKIERLGLEIKRGYVAVDASVQGRTYRFINMHLEAFSEEVRVAQTHQLIESLRAETLPIVLVGDFNTPAPDGTAYQLLRDTGYIDTWQIATVCEGNTCCQDADLRNERSVHSKRIDQIFVYNVEADFSVIHTETVADTEEARLASGLWPSDHAGVVAKLNF